MLSKGAPWHKVLSLLAALAAIATVAGVLIYSQGEKSPDTALRTKGASKAQVNKPVPTGRNGQGDLQGQANGTNSAKDPVVVVGTTQVRPSRGQQATGSGSTSSGSTSSGSTSSGSTSSGSTPPGSESPAPPTPDHPEVTPPAELPVKPQSPGSTVGPEPQPSAECPELGRLPIGGLTPGETDAVLLTASQRFAAMDRELQSMTANDPELKDILVCGDPLERFRNDLVIQPVFVADREFGTLVAGHNSTDPVMLLTHNEFETFKWQAAGGGGGWNLIGVPFRRDRVHGLTTIRTSLGAVVMPRDDSIGVPLVAAAWGIWNRDGARMGRPVSVPWGWGEGARQSFENGFLLLPGVTTAFEAASAPESDFQWLPLEGNVIGDPLKPNTIVEMVGRSYYVGSDMNLHWIATTSDWSCASASLRAPKVVGPNNGDIDLTLLATLPLGKVFRCDDWR